MASASKITARARTAYGAGAIALVLGVTLAGAPSGCFLDSSGLGTSGTGGSATSSSSAMSSTASASGSGGATSSSTTASSSGGTCTSAAQCGAPGACDTWACTGGKCVSQMTAEGMPCTTPPGVCDSTGACVGCLVLSMMTLGCTASEYCYQAACASCTDVKANGDETDQDCGGTHCDPCAAGKKCAAPADCLSGNCELTATPPVCVSCSDTVQNGSETDVDCGGTCAAKCALGKKCAVAGDCATGECNAGKCTSCKNGMKDGDETTTDCGGSCPGCANGKICQDATACASGICVGFICCDAPCAGTCQSCNLNIGTCTKVPVGSNIMPQSGCGTGQVCDNAQMCQTLLPDVGTGGTCAIDANCFNNHCVMGTCRLFTGDFCGAPGVNNNCSSGTCGVQHKCT